MNPITAVVVANAIELAFQLLANHLNKPEGWKPSPKDLQDFLDAQDAATPEAEKDAALKRLGLINRIPFEE